MKYVVINFLGKRGGAPLYSYEMTKGLSETGMYPVAIIPDNIENLSEWESISNCKLIKIPGYSDSYVSLLRTAFKLLFTEGRKIKKQCNQLDICCVYVPMIQPLTMLVNRLFKGKKKIVTLHDPIPHKGSKKLLVFLYTLAAKQADKIIVLSKRYINTTADLYHKDCRDIYVIPHGIFDNYKRVYDRKLRFQYNEHKVNFLFFGRITPYKGLDVLAEAFKRLAGEFDNVTLTIVGNGNFQPYRECYADVQNVTVINRWIPDEEVYGFYDGAKVTTVLPYIEATQSGVIPVAMANDSLVICSNTGGLAEQVIDGETGYLVAAGNVDELYVAMKKVVLGKYNSNIVTNAKEYILDLTWDKLAGKLTSIIEN